MTDAERLADLVQRFKRDITALTVSGSQYSETEARVEYIDPLLELLGWEMNNKSGQPNSLKDVLREESQATEVDGSPKRPDYTFRIASTRKFFVEAKKPTVDVRSNKASAFQLRSYGYTAGLPISVLTNFRTLRIYNTTLEPKSTDDADVGLIETIDYEDLEAKFEELYAKFSRPNVGLGSIEAHYGGTPTGALSVSEKFLARINDWRLRLAQDLYSRYSVLTAEGLSDIAQKVINRIIFIRMCEDRGIEGIETLRKVANKKNVIELRTLFKKLDDRYNTGLFDVTNDRLQDIYAIDASLYCSIVDEVYSPASPYSFAVLDASFLGQVYELFLAERIQIRGGQVELVRKPAYEGREVVTTPQPLVDEVVQRAIAARLTGVTLTNLSQVLELKVLDIAVGSGRFLVHALDKLVDVAIGVLNQSGLDPRIYCVSPGNFRLSFDTKKEILQRCLFGIDIDFNAVEVARFSLMVKLLEDETFATLPVGRKILPNLDRNVIWGNTVVGQDFAAASPEIAQSTVAIDWVAEGLPEKFDIAIGNPPYVKTEDMKGQTPDEFSYYKKRYTSPFQQFDKYFVFIERALDAVVEGGSVGLIVPNKWMAIEAGSKLRELLATCGYVSSIVDFGNESLFAGKSAYVCILILKKCRNLAFEYRHIWKTSDFELHPSFTGYAQSSAMLAVTSGDAWLLPADANEAQVLSMLTNSSFKLGSLVDVKNGIQTSKNDVFVIKRYTLSGSLVNFVKEGVPWQIEQGITRPYLDDSANVRSYHLLVGDALVLFPYEAIPGQPPRVMLPSSLQAKYPLAWAYLSHFQTALEGPSHRRRSVEPPPPPGVFYAYGRHQALETVFTCPKIVYSVNQLGDKYSFDSVGVAIASGGTAGEVMLLNPRKGYALEFFLGLLNQRAIEFYARKRGSPFRGGYYSRGSAVLEDIPVPILDLTNNPAHIATHSAIVSDVQALLQNRQALSTATGRAHQLLARKGALTEALLKDKFNAIWGFTAQPSLLVLPGE